MLFSLYSLWVCFFFYRLLLGYLVLPHSFQSVHNADAALLFPGLGNSNHVTQAPHSFTLVVDRKANLIIASTS